MQAYTSPRRFFGFLGNNGLAYWSLGVVVAAVIVLVGFFYNRHEIRILADGKTTQTVMRGGTVAKALQKAGVSLGEKDIVVPSQDSEITDDLEIRITRMIRVNVVADGETIEHWTPVVTVGQALEGLKIPVNKGDQVVPNPDIKLKPGDTIEVVRHGEKFLTEKIRVPYRVERQNDNSMERGTSRVVKQGQDGLIHKTIKITLRNGREVKRETVDTKIVRQSVNKVIAMGTINVKSISRGGSIRFSRVLTMGASGYTHTGRNTASGIYPYRGAVAVDPGVIRMGTKMYVEGYGLAKALDVGSAIRGNKIDLFFDTEREARRWGRRPVKVYILE